VLKWLLTWKAFYI